MTDTKLEDKRVKKGGTVARRWRQAAKHKLFAVSVENHVHVHASRVTDVVARRDREGANSTLSAM